MTLIAFHGKQEVKDFYLSRVKLHQQLDEIHQGQYVNEVEKKYCAVGCTIHGSNHKAYEDELGIPMILARLEDGIFEGLPIERAKLWPEQFLNIIKVGSNLSSVWPKFAVWLLTDSDHGVIKFAKTDQQRKTIQSVSDAYSRYENITLKEWKEIRTAYAAAYAAAYVAYVAYAAYATAYATDIAAAAAAAAADADADVAAAYAAYAAYAADVAAKHKARIVQADKLLELLAECEPK